MVFFSFLLVSCFFKFHVIRLSIHIAFLSDCFGKKDGCWSFWQNKSLLCCKCHYIRSEFYFRWFIFFFLFCLISHFYLLHTYIDREGFGHALQGLIDEFPRGS
ncbi:hypothetical protein ASPZODRAFT_1320116 [Penicilliopsis zonata CBS 506.65]|uniref:Uncharacterized protein n=1 Tax=Penicilliopsis zonata CBS 506.65 TaxID=1073090 RepID=A0A1L9SP46_9EURO|nr:hypothetical protein ASPZODRAFT_1320116 [Penicilliopsis zonata CBS 506.65]OJJ48797.1 hypothetical protein ASPZODRAFT_1320116 [Penicilliopsis zonata CBS 506.65]